MGKVFLFPILLLFFSLACHKSDQSKVSKEAAPSAFTNVFYVRTTPVINSKLGDVVHVTGVIESDTDAKPAFKTGGVIAHTYVNEGDRVRKGQLLARLNMTEIDAQATQAQFALDKALRDQQRAKNLYADSIATLEQLQNATTAVDMAQKTLQIAKFNMAYSEVRSPIDGKVVKQMLQEGKLQDRAYLHFISLE